MTNTTFDRLAAEQTVVVTTFRKDGTGVPTAVNVVVRGDHAYFRTWNTAGKAKRLARNPHVEIAPSTFLGKATDAPIRATARLLDDKDPAVAWIKRALPKKNKLTQPLVPLMHRLSGKKTLCSSTPGGHRPPLAHPAPANYELTTDE